MNTPFGLSPSQCRENIMAWKRQKDASERAPHERAGPAPVVGSVSTGSGAVPASELFLLADLWETRFRDRRLDAEYARNHHEYRRASELTQESLAYKTAFTELRQLVAYQDRRQPLLNTKVSHAPEKGRMVSVGCDASFGSAPVQCWVERLSPKRITITEPLSWKAPSIAQPYCCYWNTVIFYVWPHQTKRDGMSFLEWDRVDYCFPCDSEAVVDGQIYSVGTGRVIRFRGAWWIRHNARLRAPNAEMCNAPKPGEPST